mmetsp:Transcript_1382/g.1685  ORF Transcript_1382/g.1685 Transcript_1382/m.1685 type:complete len:86 (+) Transcript_1382:1174-1431(+)
MIHPKNTNVAVRIISPQSLHIMKVKSKNCMDQLNLSQKNGVLLLVFEGDITIRNVLWYNNNLPIKILIEISSLMIFQRSLLKKVM